MIQNPDERLFKMIGELVGEYEDKGVFVNPTVAPIHPPIHPAPAAAVMQNSSHTYQKTEKETFALFLLNNYC